MRLGGTRSPHIGVFVFSRPVNKNGLLRVKLETGTGIVVGNQTSASNFSAFTETWGDPVAESVGKMHYSIRNSFGIGSMSLCDSASLACMEAEGGISANPVRLPFGRPVARNILAAKGGGVIHFFGVSIF